MVRVDAFLQDGRVVRFQVSGHSGHGRAGEDIVCAAVSALVLNAINSCEHLLQVQLDTVDDDDVLTCRVPASAHAEEVQLLLRSMLFGIEQTAESYPKHVLLGYHGAN